MTLHRSRTARRLSALGLGVVLAAAFAGVAAAHHAEVVAEMDCDGNVTFTSTAWNGETEASRTNPDIGVWASVDGGAFVELFSDDYYFGPPDHFSFTDTFAASGALSVTIRVQAQANWGNGVGPGDAREDTALAPEDCEEEPTPTPTPTPTPSPTPTPTDTTTAPPTPVATPAPVSTPREGTQGGNPLLPDTAVGEGDQTGGWLVAAGAALLLGITQLVRERRIQQRSR